MAAFPNEFPFDDAKTLLVLLKSGEVLNQPNAFIQSSAWVIGCCSAMLDSRTFGTDSAADKRIEDSCTQLTLALDGDASEYGGPLVDWITSKYIRVLMNALKRFICEHWDDIFGEE